MTGKCSSFIITINFKYSYYKSRGFFIHWVEEPLFFLNKSKIMAKQISLSTGKVYDTDVQAVSVRQFLIGYGAYMSQKKYVASNITHSLFGYSYELIDIETAEFRESSNIKPLSQIYGIGIYFDDKEVKLMDETEFASLLEKATANKNEKETIKQEQLAERIRVEAVGAELLRKIIIAEVKAIIIAKLNEDESDSMSDYHGYSTKRSVILGLSTSNRNSFDEMRKMAKNLEGTHYLIEKNEDYEHRENYSGGQGYYLGNRIYSGWNISKEKIYDIEQVVRRYSYAAGLDGGICIPLPSSVSSVPVASVAAITPIDMTNVYVTLVKYSPKSIAVFGDTAIIKEDLKNLGGRFNRALTLNGSKQCGWVFPITKEREVRIALQLSA